MVSLILILLASSGRLLAQSGNPPGISFIGAQGVYPNSTSRPVAFVVGDDGTPANLLSVAGSSADQTLISTDGILFSGALSNRSVTFVPVANQTGSTTITLTVTDTNGSAASNSFALDVKYFSALTNGFAALLEGSAVWGDYDNDGWLDALISGQGATGAEAHLYHNNGNGTFIEINAGLTNGPRGISSWADYNRDGRLDILLTAEIPRLYRNDGNGVFTPVNCGLPIIHGGFATGAIAWGDFDNDGDLDIALSGQSTNLMRITVVYRNNGNDTFTDVQAGLPGTYGGSLDWGDYDNDGDLDLLMSGRTAGDAHIARIYRNDNGILVEAPSNLTGVWFSSVHWGDYDNDGDLDILLTGSVGDYNPQGKIYRNDNGAFTDIGANLTPIWFGQSCWVDFDGDGYLDVIMAGRATNDVTVTRLFWNNHNQAFIPVAAGLTNIQFGTFPWGDYDKDGDLDVFLMGYGCTWGCTSQQLYRNNGPSNSPPSAPLNLVAEYLPNNELGFRWNFATDTQTPAPGLSYNLRVGTLPGGSDIVSPHSDSSSGWRRIAEPAPVHTNRWRLRGLPKGTYYWSVQAVDTAFAASAFASEQTFTVTNTSPNLDVVQEVRVGPSVLTTLAVTVTDGESPSSQITLTAQTANGAFIPQSTVHVQGSGASRTVSFTVAAGQFGTSYLNLRATDPAGSYREVRVRVISELFTATPIPGSTNFYSLEPMKIGFGWPYGNAVVDVDRDGDFDVLMQGSILSNNYIVAVSVIASNDGAGHFTFNIVSNFTGNSYSFWLDDFNRDGKVDILSPSDSYSTRPVELFPGDGVGGFGAPLGLGASNLTMLADMDNDGDLDGLAWVVNKLTGSAQGLGYFENKNGLFKLRPGPPLISFTTAQESSAARVTDIDWDGDIDFFIPGYGTNPTEGLVMRTLRNSGLGQFTSEYFPILGQASLYGIYAYDGNDSGDLDVQFSYSTGYSGPIVSGLAANNGSGQFSFNTNNLVPSPLALDFDNDGDPDRMVSELVSASPYKTRYRLYRKDGPGQYTPQSFVISDAGFEADFDGDGDLDYIAATEEADEFGYITSPRQWRFFRNNTDRTNAPPSTPSGLTAVQYPDDRVRFSWNATTDDHTSAPFLTYNLRIGTTPGGIDVLAPCASTVTGRRWLSSPGNIGALTFRNMRGLPSGTYYWSVQAIDGVFAASAWSAERTITMARPSISPLPDIVTPPGVTSKPIAFSVTGGSSPVSALNITVVADDTTLIPSGGIVVTGTGTNRILRITPANKSGDTELTVTATDQAGFSAIVRCQVHVAWWDVVQLQQIGIQRFEEWHWADVDRDGLLDFFGYVPLGTSQPQLFSFHNLGNALFETVSNNLPASLNYPIEVAGFAGDNSADVLTLQRPDDNTSLLRVWQGTGAGFNFVPFNEVSNRSAVIQHKWLDLDNDGWRDVVHYGWATPAPSNAPDRALLIARGKPGGAFEYLPQRIGMTSAGVIAAADFDLDGDFDLVVTGVDYDAGTNFLRVYFNEGGSRFTPNTAGLPQAPSFYKASVADYDRDGWPDLLLSPYVTSTNVARLMRNVGGTFVEVASPLPAALDITTWADFDNDGDLDLLGVCSVDLSYIDFGPSSAAIYRNDGGTLTRADVGLPPIAAHQATFADADNDGDLDLLISGETGWNQTARYLCLNTSTRTNTSPPPPTNLSVNHLLGPALLQWTPVADAESLTALTYNLRVGTTPGGSQIMSAVADPITGKRRLSDTGNIGHAPRWRLFLPDGTYYWSVQSIDAGLAASPFAPEAMFTFYHPTISSLSDVVRVPNSGPAIQPFQIGDTDSTADSLTVSAFSSNTGLLPLANILLSGSGSNRFISVNAAPGVGGTSLVSVVVTDVMGLAATNSFTFEVNFFNDVTPVFSGSNYFNPRWADYDNDNDLDLYYGGFIYRNDGGAFVQAASPGLGNRNGVGWGDYDRDGDLDLALANGTAVAVYRNNGNGTFTNAGLSLPLTGAASIAWGDFDNDGDLDLVVGQPTTSRLYRNDLGAFVEINAGLPPASDGAVAWGDFDRDGDLDLLIAGLGLYSTDWRAEIYRNDTGGKFTPINAGLFGVDHASVAWADYDNDGWLDPLVAGFNFGSYVLNLYHNNGDGTFSNSNINLQGVAYGDANFADFDNDGFPDIHVNGCIVNYCDTFISRIYRNNHDGTFYDLDANLQPTTGNPAAWGDYDNDGDLDLLVNRLYRNNCNVSNSPPSKPTGTVADLLTDNAVGLRWNLPNDLQNTNPAGLSYAVRMGTSPGAGDYASPQANPANGYRRLPARGPLNTNSCLLRDVPRGTFYWSVQAIDAGFAGSQFSAEGSFTITNARPAISAMANQFTVPGRATPPTPFTVSDFETPATSLTVMGFSTNAALVPNGNISFGGGGSNRTVSVTPLPGLSGVTTIILAVTDGGGLVATSRFDVVVEYFTAMSNGLPSITLNGASAWGDYDNDGDLDIGAAGEGLNYTTIYRNYGGFFTNQGFVLGNPTGNDLAWADYDNDGDVDLTGEGWLSSGYTPTTFIFRNNSPANSFASLTLAGITNTADGSISWADYDNDGDLDLLLTGDTNTYHTPDAFTRLYRNDRGVFTNSGLALPPLVKSATAWGDYDADGDLDLLLAGRTNSAVTSATTELYRNDGNGNFTRISSGVPGVGDCAVAFADYDNDGDLDFVVSGLAANSAPLTRIYRNLGNSVFTNSGFSLVGVSSSTVSWGDFDNDGYLDIVVSGSTNALPSGLMTQVYRNNAGASFSNVGAILPGTFAHNCSWGDYDNDGDLDLLIGSRLYRNNWNLPNIPPGAPLNLFAVLTNTESFLLWSPSADVQTTNSRGLSYNIRIGTNSGGSQIMSAQSSPTNGFHRLPNFGNAGPTNLWRISNLTNGTYFWSVQAIDPGLAASAFASEESFTVSRPIISAITNRSVAPNTNTGPINFTVFDAETAASNLVVTASSSDTNLIPPAAFAFSGGDTNRSLTITPVLNRSGSASITVIARDESGQSSSRSFLLTVERFGDIGAGLATTAGPISWGDFDNDSDLDLVKGPVLYRNHGNNVFSNVLATLSYNEGFGGWADYDNDGKLDLLAVGANATKIFRGDGAGNLTDIAAGLPPASLPRQSAAWGDYDNDGDLDIVLAGASFTRLYRNNGSNAFTEISAGLPSVPNGAVAWADYDKDGDLDLLVAGNALVRLYRNNGNSSFTDLSLGLPGLYYASVAWGDYDNDGFIDFVVAGSANNTASGVVTRIYHSGTNQYGLLSITNLYPVPAQGPVGVWKGAVAWGDYDNDGDLDLLVTGESTNASAVTRIYRNDNGAFFDSGHGLPALKNSFAAWGDFDRDGNLDLALSGMDAAAVHVSRIYRNYSPAPTNTLPNPPASLTNFVVGKSVNLTWSSGTDSNQSSGLTYNVRVGTSPGAGNIVSALAKADGVRLIPAMGNAGQRLGRSLTNLTGGVYYWSVQAVDAGFAGSAFAVENSFTISNRAPSVVTRFISLTEDTVTNIVLSGSDLDGDSLTFGIASQPLFGQLTGSPPNITYRPVTNYFGFDRFLYLAADRTTNSAPGTVFIEVKPVEDVVGAQLSRPLFSGGQLQLNFAGEPWRSYQLEASEDLVHWVPLASFVCTNLLTSLIDADAAHFSHRFYRAALIRVAPQFGGPLIDQSGFSFNVAGQVGRNYRIQVSSDLRNWTTLVDLLLTNSIMPFIDADAKQFNQRFYRVIAP